MHTTGFWPDGQCLGKEDDTRATTLHRTSFAGKGKEKNNVVPVQDVPPEKDCLASDVCPFFKNHSSKLLHTDLQSKD